MHVPRRPRKAWHTTDMAVHSTADAATMRLWQPHEQHSSTVQFCSWSCSHVGRFPAPASHVSYSFTAPCSLQVMMVSVTG
jgi:hypothetical protein